MSSNNFKFFYFVLIFLMSSVSNSYGYIDPGTGSFIIQAILAIAASIFFYIGYPIRIIKKFFQKIFKKKKDLPKKNIQE